MPTMSTATVSPGLDPVRAGDGVVLAAVLGAGRERHERRAVGPELDQRHHHPLPQLVLGRAGMGVEAAPTSLARRRYRSAASARSRRASSPCASGRGSGRRRPTRPREAPP